MLSSSEETTPDNGKRPRRRLWLALVAGLVITATVVAADCWINGRQGTRPNANVSDDHPSRVLPARVEQMSGLHAEKRHCLARFNRRAHDLAAGAVDTAWQIYGDDRYM